MGIEYTRMLKMDQLQDKLCLYRTIQPDPAVKLRVTIRFTIRSKLIAYRMGGLFNNDEKYFKPKQKVDSDK